MSAPAASLERALRLPHATAMVVGTIIGASIFVQPSEMTGAVPSIAGVLAAWAVAGLLTIAGALICAELASAYPRTGGVSVFLNETLSPAAGFLSAWAMFWSMHTGIIAAIAVIFARYLAYFVPLSPAGLRGVAIAAIVVLSAVNYAGVRHGSRVQAALKNRCAADTVWHDGSCSVHGTFGRKGEADEDATADRGACSGRGARCGSGLFVQAGSACTGAPRAARHHRDPRSAVPPARACSR